MFPKLAYAMIKNGKQSYASQLISILYFQTWYEYSFFQISLCDDKKIGNKVMYLS